MSTMVKEIYEAFKNAGVDEELAVAAAQAVPSAEDLATKGDLVVVKSDLVALKGDVAVLKGDLAALKADLYRQLWLVGVGLLGAMVALKLFA